MEFKCKSCSKSVCKTISEVKKSKSGNVFCSRSCAARYNNRKHPKRSLSGKCKKCSKPIAKRYAYCKDCYTINLLENKTYNESKTYKDYYSNKKYQRNSEVRQHARRKYFNSNRPKSCVVCGYDLHIDVCHIKDISSYHCDTLIGEINSLSNLIALCKNHHWEFDHNKMSKQDLEKIEKYTQQDSNLRPAAYRMA